MLGHTHGKKKFSYHKTEMKDTLSKVLKLKKHFFSGIACDELGGSCKSAVDLHEAAHS